LSTDFQRQIREPFALLLRPEIHIKSSAVLNEGGISFNGLATL
jgi:hypothetical protein